MAGSSSYPEDITFDQGQFDQNQFANLVEAATAASNANSRDLKRKRGDEDVYGPVSSQGLGGFAEPQKTPTLANSAAVLFREPSEKSKKYSRPPLGKVFSSLELEPEAFLELQNAAKNYMLSDEHPERRDVVGHKKQNGNNDTAKLKLYQCVEQFLQQDGIGDKYFGHTVDMQDPEAPPRSFFWPEDRSRIVKLLMPLLRKMVTNERQRLYAAETRKSDPKKVEPKVVNRSTTDNTSVEHKQEQISPDIDPSLQPTVADDNTASDTAALDSLDDQQADSGELTLHANVIHRENGNTSRVVPEIVLPAAGAPTLEQFVDGLKKNIGVLGDDFEVRALLPHGLTLITSEAEWVLAQMTVLTEVWMNAQLQLVIEI